MNLSKAVELFIASVRAEGRSVHTAAWYEQCLERLVLFLNDPGLNAIVADDLRRFLVDLHERNLRYTNHQFRKPQRGALSPYTIQGYVRAIKRLYSWLVENDHLSPAQNVAVKLKRQSLPRTTPKDISEEDVRALLSASRQSKFPQRDYALILFLADTGCRVGGLVGLPLSDLEHGRVLVTEKGRKSRFVFLSSHTISALREWLTVRQSLTEFVFVNRWGDQFTIWGVYQALGTVAELAGVKGRFNPHGFRHRYAKRFLMDGGDLASLSRLMGHTDVSVTSNSYSVFLTEELKQKHDQHSPLKRIV